MKRNREAPTLYFDHGTDMGLSTVGAIASEFKPRSDFEKSIASILQNKAVADAYKSDGAKILELNKVTAVIHCIGFLVCIVFVSISVVHFRKETMCVGVLNKMKVRVGFRGIFVYFYIQVNSFSLRRENKRIQVFSKGTAVNLYNLLCRSCEFMMLNVALLLCFEMKQRQDIFFLLQGVLILGVHRTWILCIGMK